MVATRRSKKQGEKITEVVDEERTEEDGGREERN
jgi:hypothetical protein